MGYIDSRQPPIKKKRSGACFGSTYCKIGMKTPRLAWTLIKDDRQICEAFVFLFSNEN